jgi:hypothetical protein
MSSELLIAPLKQTHKYAITIPSIQRSNKYYSQRSKFVLQNTRENEK